MKVEIVKIGNSRGVRIPKPLLEACRLHGSVNLDIEDGKLVMTPGNSLREGWEESFRNMAKEGDDLLLIGDEVSPNPEDADWQW
jgi:antitoxin MazE